TFEVGKQDCDLLALPGQSAAGGENLLREIRWGVGEGCLARALHGHRGDGGTGASATRPDQYFPVLIGGEPLALDQFNLQILQRRIIELKLPLERTIGHPPPLAQEDDHLVQDRDKVHLVSPSGWCFASTSLRDSIIA